MEHKYFKTGDIAKFSNVSSDTVRYYDKENVVTPTVTKDNRYRYYTFSDALKFDTATLLRELSFSLSKLKEYLQVQSIDEVLSFHEDHIESLQNEQRAIEKKICYLKEFDRRMKNFKDLPNELNYIEDETIYICNLLIFSVDKSGFHLDNPDQKDCVKDTFWSRTSVIGFTNTIENMNSPEMGRAFCFNIVQDDGNEVEKVNLRKALRFNYIGDPFTQSDYLEEIFKKVTLYCKQKNLNLSGTFYELYYLCQNVEENPSYYIHIYFPIK